MIHFEKAQTIKNQFSKIISDQDLIRSLFLEMPDLQCFTIEKTNEYDDENYTDYMQVLSVNNYNVDYDLNYEEEEKELDEQNNLPKIKEEYLGSFGSLIYDLNYVEYGETTFSRENYDLNEDSFSKSILENIQRTVSKYAISFISETSLDVDYFVNKHPRYAVYYAMERGRFNPEDEFKIFAQKGRMKQAYEYAKCVIKGNLPEKIENFFILNDSVDEDDHEQLQRYLSEIKLVISE